MGYLTTINVVPHVWIVVEKVEKLWRFSRMEEQEEQAFKLGLRLV